MANPENAQFSNISAAAFVDRAMVQTALGAAGITLIPRQIFWVDSQTGSSSYDGLSRGQPKATLAQALGLAGVGDVVCLLAGHAETLSSTTQGIAHSQSGVVVIGLGGETRARPALTCGAANIVGYLLSGNNNTLYNLRIIGSTSQTSAASYGLSITGTDNVIDHCVFEHGGAGPLRMCGMTGASRTIWRSNDFIGTAAGPDVAIFGTNAIADSKFLRNTFNYQGSAGLDSAAVFGSAGVAHAGNVFRHNVGLCMDLNMFDINGSHASISLGDSLMAENYSVGSAAQTVANTYDAGGSQLAGNWVSDALASPAVTTGAVGIGIAGTHIPSGSPVS